MNACIRVFRSLALPLGIVAAAGATPLNVSYLTPDSYAASVGDSVCLRFFGGAAKDARPTTWPDNRVDWLFFRGGPEQHNQHNVRPAHAGENFVRVPLRHMGVTLIGVDQRPLVCETTVGDLREFAQEHVAPDEMLERLSGSNVKLRVRHVTSAKTLVRVTAPDGRRVPSAIGTSKTGQVVEIRPVFDPTAIQVGSDLPLSVYIDGEKKAGVKVQATGLRTGKTTSYITGPGGAGHFRVTEPGVWRVQVHHAEPLHADPSADWVVYSGTLTFEVPAKGAER